MATLKEIKSKIVSVKKTKQITSAMKMVATSRLRSAQNNMERFEPYAEKFTEVLGSIAGNTSETSNPLLLPVKEVKKIGIVFCTSDRGLCGGFNANLITKVQNFIDSLSDDKTFSLTCFGKRGVDWAKKESYNISEEFIGVVGSNIEFSVAASSGQKLIDSFLKNDLGEVHLIYSKFINMAKQEVCMKQILPIPSIDGLTALEGKDESQKAFLPEHICEPSPEVLFGKMLPKNVFIQLYDALLQTSTSEHAARMRAMENATKACDDMATELQTIFNKTRQAAITADLMDIVCGAEALKG